MQTQFNHPADPTDQVCSLIAEVFQLPIEQVNPELAYGDLPAWDSLGHMEVMMALETQFGVEISTDTIGQLTSVPAICAYLKENHHV